MTKYCLTILFAILTHVSVWAAPGDPVYVTNAEVCRGASDYVNLNDLFITDIGTTDVEIVWWLGLNIEANIIADPTRFPTPQATNTTLRLAFRKNGVTMAPITCRLRSIASSTFKVMDDDTICHENTINLHFKDISSDVHTVTWTNLNTGATHVGQSWVVTPVAIPSSNNLVKYLVEGESSTAGTCSTLSDTVVITVNPTLVNVKTLLTTNYEINKGIINLNTLLKVETEDMLGQQSIIKHDSDNPPLIKWNVTWAVSDPENYLLTANVDLYPVIDIQIDLCGGNIKYITSQKITIKAIGDDAYITHESVSSPGNRYPNIVCVGDDVVVKILAGANDKIKKVEWIEPAIPDANKTEIDFNEWHYTWSINATTKFKANIILENNISYPSEITIDAKKVPSLIAKTDTTVCSYNPPVNLTGLLNTPDYIAGTVTWTPLHPVTSDGTYIATATAKYQCQSMAELQITGNINVTSFDAVSVNTMDNTDICQGNSITLTAEASNGNSLTWGASVGGTPLTSTTVTPALGTNIYYAWVNSSCGIIYDSVTITVKPLPVFTLTPVTTTLCEGDKVILTTETPSNVDSILWNVNGTWINNMQVEVTPINSPTYKARGYKNGCYTEAQVSVATLATPNLTIDGGFDVCSESSLTLSATTTTSGAIITWFDESGNSFQNNTVINNPVNGATYRAEVSNGGLCTTKETVRVSILPIPSVVAMNDTAICYGSSISLYTLSNEGTITWDVPNVTFVPTETATYTVTASSLQCGSASDQVTITVHDKLYINPDVLPEYKAGNLYDVTLQTNAISSNFTISNGSLPFGFGLSSWGIISGSANQGEVGISEFTVKVSDAYGCSTEKEYSIKEDLRIPEIFTPNGDGINDIFMRNTEVVIFNRLGIKIYDGNDGWDGTYNGNVQPPDTYFYLITTVDSKGNKKKSTGSITIIGR